MRRRAPCQIRRKQPGAPDIQDASQPAAAADRWRLSCLRAVSVHSAVKASHESGSARPTACNQASTGLATTGASSGPRCGSDQVLFHFPVGGFVTVGVAVSVGISDLTASASMSDTGVGSAMDAMVSESAGAGRTRGRWDLASRDVFGLGIAGDGSRLCDGARSGGARCTAASSSSALGFRSSASVDGHGESQARALAGRFG